MIKLILAIDKNNALGNKGDLLFHIPQDLRRYKELTSGNIVVFGRKSYESLPVRPLPSRLNCVLTRNKKYEADHKVFVTDSVEKILNHYSTTNGDDKDLYICGGSDVYSAFMEHADEVLLTYIDAEAENADTFFNRRKLEELFYLSGMERNYCEKNDVTFFYFTYKKKPAQN